MGLTAQSTGSAAMGEAIKVKKTPDDFVIALAGNPNTGKSTLFNELTGLNQHTGNWPGKTVTNAQGICRHRDRRFIFVDLPGTYSLLVNSVEEQVARDFILLGNPDATIVVADATNLERNMNLVLQITEMTSNIILCINLMDEARRKHINIDINRLSGILGIPVVGISARNGEGLDKLMDTVYRIVSEKITAKPMRIAYGKVIENAVKIMENTLAEAVNGKINPRWLALRLLDGDQSITEPLNHRLGCSLMESNGVEERLNEARDYLAQREVNSESIRDDIVTELVCRAERIATETVHPRDKECNHLDRRIDNILTSRVFGIPIMIGLLGIIFWLTIEGANYPSQALSSLFNWVEQHLTQAFMSIVAPEWLHGILILGVYRTLAWVVSVMLPPMAVFFPLFTLLEDLGYLPRVAFNLDNYFKKACAHGKQALTMCMGFGCNAAGVIGCRIIDSPRERMIATLTNNFVPCNGRFPTFIALAVIFVGGLSSVSSVAAVLVVLGIVILGVVITLLISKLLSMTILKGMPSSFTLELPPYRRPQIGRIIIRSIFDRTIFVLGRAVIVAAPAGLIIWLMANTQIAGTTLLNYGADFLQPFGHALGMDGFIILAFILGLPANEIVVPIIIMSYMSTGSIIELESLSSLGNLLTANGWTWLTAVNVMLFSLLHWPCGTTLLTIKKETQSIKWTAISFVIPTVAGILVCLIFTQTVRLLGFV